MLLILLQSVMAETHAPIALGTSTSYCNARDLLKADTAGPMPHVDESPFGKDGQRSDDKDEDEDQVEDRNKHDGDDEDDQDPSGRNGDDSHSDDDCNDDNGQGILILTGCPLLVVELKHMPPRFQDIDAARKAIAASLNALGIVITPPVGDNNLRLLRGSQQVLGKDLAAALRPFKLPSVIYRVFGQKSSLDRHILSKYIGFEDALKSVRKTRHNRFAYGIMIRCPNIIRIKQDGAELFPCIVPDGFGWTVAYRHLSCTSLPTKSRKSYKVKIIGYPRIMHKCKSFGPGIRFHGMPSTCNAGRTWSNNVTQLVSDILANPELWGGFRWELVIDCDNPMEGILLLQDHGLHLIVGDAPHVDHHSAILEILCQTDSGKRINPPQFHAISPSDYAVVLSSALSHTQDVGMFTGHNSAPFSGHQDDVLAHMFSDLVCLIGFNQQRLWNPYLVYTETYPEGVYWWKVTAVEADLHFESSEWVAIIGDERVDLSDIPRPIQPPIPIDHDAVIARIRCPQQRAEQAATDKTQFLASKHKGELMHCLKTRNELLNMLSQFVRCRFCDERCAWDWLREPRSSRPTAPPYQEAPFQFPLRAFGGNVYCPNHAVATKDMRSGPGPRHKCYRSQKSLPRALVLRWFWEVWLLHPLCPYRRVRLPGDPLDIPTPAQQAAEESAPLSPLSPNALAHFPPPSSSSVSPPPSPMPAATPAPRPSLQATSVGPTQSQTPPPPRHTTRSMTARDKRDAQVRRDMETLTANWSVQDFLNDSLG